MVSGHTERRPHFETKSSPHLLNPFLSGTYFKLLFFMHLLLFGGAFCFHNWDGLVTWALPAEDHVTSALGAQTKWPPGTHGIRIYNMENVFLQGPHGICPNFEIFFVHIAKHTWHL